MNCRSGLGFPSAGLLFAALGLPAGYACAQDAMSIAGTYAIVTNAPFGDNPRGQLILGRDGHYSIMLARANLPKVAANARDKGTADENMAIIGGSIAHVGKYTVDAESKLIIFNVEVSTFPNWDGMAFKRPFRVSGDQLIYMNNSPSVGGAPIETVWKRVQ